MHVGWVVRDYMKNPEGMVTVAVDPDSLYEKMTTGNLKVCASCKERKKQFGKLWLEDCGSWFRCPYVPMLSLIEDTHLPKECPKKFEHLVAFSYGREKEKNNEA